MDKRQKKSPKSRTSQQSKNSVTNSSGKSVTPKASNVIPDDVSRKDGPGGE